MPRYPNPDGERRNKNPHAFGWTDLPAAGRPGKAPDLPTYRKWPPTLRAYWRRLWRTPQATQWREDDPSLVRMVELFEATTVLRDAPASFFAELRQLEADHGLTPKALLQLRWRIVDEVAEEAPASPSSSPAPADELAQKRADRRRRIS